MFLFLGTKFLDKVFSFNKEKLKANKNTCYLQLESKDYRSPSELVEVCVTCHRKYDV